MIECCNCKENIGIYDQYCKHCGTKQNKEENWQRYLKQTTQPYIDKCLMQHNERDWFALLWKNVDEPKEHSNLSDFGNRLLVLEIEKETFEIEMRCATKKSFEKKKHSYEIRVKKITELVNSLEKMKKGRNFLTKTP